MQTTEQELFSGGKVTQSRNALQRTGYFEDVQLTTKKTDQPDTVDLVVDVKEGPTGTFSIGAGIAAVMVFFLTRGFGKESFRARAKSQRHL